MHFGNHHLWWLGCSLGMAGVNMNEPAFPTKINTEHFSHPSTIYNTGMTLRDYFAAKAMQALIAHEEQASRLSSANIGDFDVRVAFAAYRYADAMLERKNK
jgi:hypothetical protein